MKVPSSRSISRRSRAVFLPRACCFSTARSDPAWATSATRRLRSASLPAVVERSDSTSLGMLRNIALPVVAGSLDGEVLRAALLTPGSPWQDVEHHATIASTNARAAMVGRPWRVVVADHQSSGRGRLARSWEAPPGTSVAVSATVPLPAGAQGWLPLLAGLAVAEAITAETGLAADLKWPNDVLLPGDDDRKVCGVLCEVVTGIGDAFVVVGAGINVDQTREQLPVDTATSLTLSGAPEVDRNRLVVAYLSRLAHWYA